MPRALPRLGRGPGAAAAAGRHAAPQLLSLRLLLIFAAASALLAAPAAGDQYLGCYEDYSPDEFGDPAPLPRIFSKMVAEVSCVSGLAPHHLHCVITLQLGGFRLRVAAPHAARPGGPWPQNHNALTGL